MEKILSILERMEGVLDSAREPASLRRAINTKSKELKSFFDTSYGKWSKKYGKMTKDYKAEISAARDTLLHMGKNKMFLYQKGDEEDFGYQMGIIELVGGVGVKECNQIKESLMEGFTPAQQIYNDISSHLDIGQRTPIQRKTWINIIKKRLSKGKVDPGQFALVLARQLEQGNFLYKHSNFKKVKDAIEDAVRRVS